MIKLSGFANITKVTFRRDVYSEARFSTKPIANAVFVYIVNKLARYMVTQNCVISSIAVYSRGC